jgi:hypothetical protein
MQRLGCGVGDELAPVGTPFLHSHQIGRCLEVSGVTSGKASGRDVTVKPPKNGYGESNEVIYLPLDRGAGAAQPRAVSPAVTTPAQPARSAAPAAGFASAPWKRSA